MATNEFDPPFDYEQAKALVVKSRNVEDPTGLEMDLGIALREALDEMTRHRKMMISNDIESGLIDELRRGCDQRREAAVGDQNFDEAMFFRQLQDTLKWNKERINWLQRMCSDLMFRQLLPARQGCHDAQESPVSPGDERAAEGGAV